jgi:hypothetical protein
MIKIIHRLKKLERRLLPSDVGTCTLEELCRAMWRQDKRQFLEIAKSSSLSLFARQFEIDDGEGGRADGRMGIRILDLSFPSDVAPQRGPVPESGTGTLGSGVSRATCTELGSG